MFHAFFFVFFFHFLCFLLINSVFSVAGTKQGHVKHVRLNLLIVMQQP